MTALIAADARRWRCASPSCGALLVKCHNYAIERVCNRCCIAPGEASSTSLFCDYCRFNDTIPDLAVPGNREKWGRLEAAKRRLLYTLDLVGLPYGARADGFEPPLAFDFKMDKTQGSGRWWATGQEERVYTGHADGKITINLLEADPVERERMRVMFQEAHRTLIGHFRHEIAHYYWQMLVQNRCETEFKAVFGDHMTTSYAESQTRYYEIGPPNGWQANYISTYATMHPWEDFAETFATYLDIVSVLDTAQHLGVSDALDPVIADLASMVDRYIRLGVVLNEMNRAMGLLDYVPELFGEPIVAKMEFVHRLIRQSRSGLQAI